MAEFRDKVRALVDALDAALPHINDIVALEAVRTGSDGYAGPNFGDELEAVREALELDEPHD